MLPGMCSGKKGNVSLKTHWLLGAGYEQTGCAQSMFANRLSWWFDFRGPSKCIDTGELRAHTTSPWAAVPGAPTGCLLHEKEPLCWSACMATQPSWQYLE